ncbi:DUF2252 domain-containing protein [Rhodococcus oryzae]|uniref:DUF2252 domain-containing protein n=1 Tax=Rhodococcus oryzae TaxID=2571143 RepID=A0ABY2RPI5_9NOCA|nr:DUF2252 domain-containing protein [Rhodococcus oryzae]TJZ80331.1 DUF2252 domain-containing protein [Rhodococcus oryzae]
MAVAAFDTSEPAAERRRRGKHLRARIPRGAHGSWEPSSCRPDPVSILDRQNANRIPELVPLRFERMLVSPFTFLRGSAAIMAWDLAHCARTDLTVMASGDAHLANFGLFAGPDRRLVFDLNDFDEVHRGPFEWDLKRLATSALVAATTNGHSASDARAAALIVGAAYRETIRHAAQMPALDVWYLRIEADAMLAGLRDQITARQVGAAEAVMAKAERRTQLGSLKRFARHENGRFLIKDEPPLIARLPHERHAEVTDLLRASFERYLGTLAGDRRELVERYRFQDIASKVVGVGSVGMLGFMALFVGESAQDPLFLQIKEAQPSVLAPYVPGSPHRDQGRRVVEGQRLIQSASDPFLGWFSGPGPFGRDFYVRQLRDKKGSFSIAAMDPSGLRAYARLCAIALARAHARTGDPAAIAGYLGNGTAFDEAIAEFAVVYGEQNRLDYEEVRRCRSSAVTET